MRRPWFTTVPVVLILLGAASPLLHISFGSPDQRALPTRVASRQVADTIQNGFPGNAGAATDLLILGPAPPAAVAAFAAHLSTVDGVALVSSSAGAFAGGHAVPAVPADPALARTDLQRLVVLTTPVPKTAAAQKLTGTLRDQPGPAGTTTLLSSSDARLLDTKHAIGTRLPLAGGLIALSTFVILFLFTGSVVQPVRALLGNLLSLGATLGVVTAIFQDGWLSGWLGFTPEPLDTSMLVLLLSIAFGLSMDYEVFLIARIRELHDGGAGQRDATTLGLARTGRIVSAAAALLAVSLLAFGTSSVSFLQLFGVGTGLAVLIDATLVRGVLMPAAMRVTGRWTWYAPRPLLWMYRRIRLAD